MLKIAREMCVQIREMKTKTLFLEFWWKLWLLMIYALHFYSSMIIFLSVDMLVYHWRHYYVWLWFIMIIMYMYNDHHNHKSIAASKLTCVWLLRSPLWFNTNVCLCDNRICSKGYSIFKSTPGGGGGLNFFWGYLPPQFNFVDPPPHLHILNSILHLAFLELPCATPSSHILNYLIPPTTALWIIFRSPPF